MTPTAPAHSAWILLLCVSVYAQSSAAQEPQSILFRFDRVAVLGSVDARATIYPLAETIERQVGRGVQIKVEGDGEESFLVRMPVDSQQLPAHIPTERVRVLREGWIQWEPLPAWRIGDSLYVRLRQSNVLATVVVGGAAPRSGVALFESVLGRYRRWLAQQGGEGMTGPLRHQLDRFIEAASVDVGEVHLVRVTRGRRARSIFLGILEFFEQPGAELGYAMAIGNTIYWLAEPEDAAQRPALLANAFSRLLQQRRLQGLYLRSWAEQWLEGGEGRVLERKVEQQQVTFLRSGTDS